MQYRNWEDLRLDKDDPIPLKIKISQSAARQNHSQYMKLFGLSVTLSGALDDLRQSCLGCVGIAPINKNNITLFCSLLVHCPPQQSGLRCVNACGFQNCTIIILGWLVMNWINQRLVNWRFSRHLNLASSTHMLNQLYLQNHGQINWHLR
jgi:hypothetical protein